jgi:hypothetical protein
MHIPIKHGASCTISEMYTYLLLKWVIAETCLNILLRVRSIQDAIDNSTYLVTS